MSDYEILYYPRFEPTTRWLRSILLFVDSVNRIVPGAAKHTDGKSISELREAVLAESGALDPAPTVAPTQFDLDRVYQSDPKRMRRAFELIVSEQPKGAADDPKYISSNYNFVHRAKIPQDVLILLKEHGLLIEPAPTWVGPSPGYGFLFVQKVAGRLILSYVADQIARRKGLDAVTDYKLGFTVNALGEARVPFKPPLGSAEGLLLSSIVRCQIPAELQYLSTNAYIQVRKRFSEIRETFQSLTRELAANHRFDRVEDMEELQTKVEKCAEDFGKKVDKYRKSKAAGKVKKWAPFCAGSILGVLFMPTGWVPLVPLAGKAVDIGFKVIEKVITKPPLNPQHDRAYQMLCGLQKDVISRSPIKNLLQLSGL